MDENSFQSVDFTQIHQHPRAVSLNDLDSLNSSNEANRNPRAVSHTLVGTTNTFNEVNHPRTPAGASEASLVVTRPQPLSQSGTSETALDIIRPQSQTPDRAVDIGPISDRSQPTGMSSSCSSNYMTD